MKNNTHIPVINSLRGIAALIVCLYHFVCTTTGYINNQFILDFFHYGQKGVQIFFIISGIVIPLSMIKVNYSYKYFVKFISKRFIRIEPPYIASVLLALIYLYVRNFIPSSAQIDLFPSVKEIVLHLGYLIPFFEDADWVNPVYWTLSVEFQYYLFLALFFPLVLKNKIVLRVFFYLLLLLPPFFLNYGQAFFTNWSNYFLLGILYSLFFLKIIELKEFILVFTITCVSVYLIQGGIDLIIGIVTLLIIHYFKNFSSSVGNFLGKISYSLYLLHSIIGAAFVNYMSHYFQQGYQKFLVIIIGTIISILSAYLFWLFIEKPSHKLAKKIKI